MDLIESADREGNEPFARSYKHLLGILQHSKAEIAGRIGKKKPA